MTCRERAHFGGSGGNAAITGNLTGSGQLRAASLGTVTVGGALAGAVTTVGNLTSGDVAGRSGGR